MSKPRSLSALVSDGSPLDDGALNLQSGTVNGLLFLNSNKELTTNASLLFNAGTGQLSATSFSGSASVTTLTASSTVTLNGGTANGVSYLNGSKVLTTGSALTFDGSDVFQLNATGNAVVNLDGASTNNAIIRLRNKTTGFLAGIFANNSKQLVFEADGAIEQMRLTSTGLGIGTSSPVGRFDALGADDTTMHFRNATAQIRFRPYVPSYATSQIAALNAAGSAYAPLAVGGSYTTIETNGIERARFDSSGNVGIGTSSPGKKLDVSGVIRATGSFDRANSNWTNAAFTASGQYGGGLALIDGASGYGIWSQDSGATFAIGQGTTSGGLTEKMRIDSSGNLLVGTTSASGAKLNVNGDYQQRGASVRTTQAVKGINATTSTITVDVGGGLEAVSYLVEISISGYSGVYLKYIHTVYKVNSWTDYGPAVVQNIASSGVSVAYSSPSNGVLRYTISVSGSTTYAVVKVNVTSGGSSNDPQTTISIT